jgi:N-terminal acetyltransferase 2
MLRLNTLSLLNSTMSTTITTKGVAAAVLKNSKFRISSVLVSNTLINPTKLISFKSTNNNILTRLTLFNIEKDATRQSIFRFSSLMNSNNSFCNSFSTLQSPKKLLAFNTKSLHPKKNSRLKNNSTSISSLAKNFSSKTTSEVTSMNEGRSMTEKFKILTKKYGVSAVAVYLTVSALDLGLTFILIQIGGADRVKKVEDWFTKNFGDWIVIRKSSPKKEENSQQDIIIQINTPIPDNTTSKTDAVKDIEIVNGNGNRSSKTPSWASTLVIAYGIHKLLVPFRLGLTAAITPAIVRKLKRMGWNIGGKH